jgi:phage baseplate assembly protein V
MLRLVKFWLRKFLIGFFFNWLIDDDYKTGGRTAQLRNLIRYGTVVSSVNTSGPHVQATWQDKGLNGVTSGQMPVLQQSTQGCKKFLLPRAGDQVISLHDPDSPEVGFIIGTLSSTSSPLTSDQNGPKLVPQSLKSDATIYDDGAIKDYDPIASKDIWSTPGEMNYTAGTTIKISATGDITITSKANINANGVIIDKNGNVTVPGNCTIQKNLIVTGTSLLNGGGTATPNLVNADGSGDGS